MRTASLLLTTSTCLSLMRACASASVTGNMTRVQGDVNTTMTSSIEHEPVSSKRIPVTGSGAAVTPTSGAGNESDTVDPSWLITILVPCVLGVVILIIIITVAVICLMRQRRIRYHLRKRRGRKAAFLSFREKEYKAEFFRESININELIFCDPACLTDSPLQTPEIARISFNSPCYQPLCENDSVYSLFSNGFANPASCTSSDDMLDPDRISVLSSVPSINLSDKDGL